MPNTSQRTSWQHLARARGFTLIEAMAASMVLGICVVAIGSAVTTSNQVAAAADDTAAALSVARADMEILASHKLESLISSPSAASQEIDLAAKGGATSPRAEGSASLNFVTRAPLQGPQDIAVVAVEAQAPNGQKVTFYRLVTSEGNGQ